ncbi:hypothetical protein J5U18_01985 [Sphingobacteriaceae bacterium WQ 2009]|uniref:Substrate import-associated zinc metallohydrolase lipoprotein n=1 Tax=Rhinopithecimicrobium faecis TaxID=2820698 RepID=A0A8T4H7T3_9SPHI|nr:hypothetical protein [Sphingobacteriaceae bacterium WQ 2009]
MKKNILYAFVSAVLILGSCSKTENLEVDLTKLNADDYIPGPIDKWIGTNITDPYNIEVVYRFERNLTDVSKDISPVALDKVQPTMEMVLELFLKPYEKIAGPTFIKKFTPKQFVLYGSTSYNTNGSVTLGTADGGRRVVLYDLNTLDNSNGENIRRRVRTIHHEFTHIINQNILIPPDFELISKADYTADWTGAANTAALAKELGFISQYARSSFGEDFAEMTAHLLVEGQVWFDNYLFSTTPAGKVKLQQKEKIVKDYFKSFFGIDFAALQAEVQRSIKAGYGVKDPADLTQTLPIWLLNNKVNTLTITPTASYHTTYGSSTSFNTIFTNYSNVMKAAGYTPQYLQFIFTNASNVVLRASTTSSTGGVVNFDYNFKLTINAISGEVVFTKSIPEGTGTTYNNGQSPAFLAAFEQYLLPYLTNRTFVASWLPTEVLEGDPLYRTFGGLSVKGAPTNYFYGKIVLK